LRPDLHSRLLTRALAQNFSQALGKFVLLAAALLLLAGLLVYLSCVLLWSAIAKILQL
jgi:hypothetical protein